MLSTTTGPEDEKIQLYAPAVPLFFPFLAFETRRQQTHAEVNGYGILIIDAGFY
jgi:hypothetical protein